ncbi:MAG: phosphatidylinositol-specific phospholipase C1-like protein [Chitinophagaceae bacterium]
MKIFLSFVVFPVICFFIADKHTDDNVPINHIQVIGSHNSYKKAIDPVLFKFLQTIDSADVSTIDYSHISLTEQLNLGLCNLEIDLYADSVGGKYAHPKGLDWAPGQTAYDETVMKQKGFKVFHMQDIDFRSNCATFKQCLEELKKWSDSHSRHNPIFITMNAKDEVEKEGQTIPEKFTTEVFDKLDAEITKYLGSDYLITPDNIRGNDATLEQSVLAGNWPTLKKARGKFIFILDEQGTKREAYIAGHPSLRKRLLFVNAEPGTPEAAICIMNDAKNDEKKIKALVKKGYIIRTRSDSDTKEARTNDKSSFIAAENSGAQIITTDYYRKSTHFSSDYVIAFDDGTYFRLNPVFANQTK